jgi:putative oxidoreductase
MNGRAGGGPTLLFPGLAGFYAIAREIGYLLVRITAGGCLLYHGWGKLMTGPPFASMVRYSIPLPTASAYFVVFLETVGAVGIILGLFTRFFAAAIAIEMAVIAFVAQMPQGFARMELFLLWGVVMFAIALRGGGPYSLDHKIGKEL